MDGNIYKNARQVAGLTQERWAEALGLAPDTIRRYENGERMPDDATVKMMAELSGLSPLAYWHLCRKSMAAAEELPEVERVPLPEAVLRLLVCIKEIQPDIDLLMQIASDGVIGATERADFDMIVEELSGLVSAALEVRYAEQKVQKK